MVRLLVVVRQSIDDETLKALCRSDGPCELAICCVLDPHGDGLRQTLRVQRDLTTALRRVLGERAERIPIFVASDRPGDTVDECARAWGATLVRR